MAQALGEEAVYDDEGQLKNPSVRDTTGAASGIVAMLRRPVDPDQ